MSLLFKKYILKNFLNNNDEIRHLEYSNTIYFENNNFVYSLYCIHELEDDEYQIIGTKSFVENNKNTIWKIVTRCEYINSIIYISPHHWNVTSLFS